MIALRAVMALAYPFLVFAGLQWLEPRHLALLAGGLVTARFALPRRRAAALDWRPLLPLALALGGVLALTWIWNERRFFLFVPALVSLALLFGFGRTLRGGRTMIEVFARRQHGELSPERVAHCRAATIAWCVFFALNAAVCGALAWSGDVERWTLYTGFGVYGAMGALFAAEFAVRVWRFGFDRTDLPGAVRRRLPEEPS